MRLTDNAPAARIGVLGLGAEVRERILRAAGGNPLFVEEMAAMVHASADGEVEVPPTLQALLTARLDQLDQPERSVLERGSVEGDVFHQGVVQALTPDESRLTSQLTGLVRKEPIRPDRALFASRRWRITWGWPRSGGHSGSAWRTRVAA